MDRVELDTKQFDRFCSELVSGITTRGPQIARRSADNVAGRIRSTVPRRTGRLAASVDTQRVEGGAAVTYGSGVPYAGYIEKRTGTVAAAVAGADRLFGAECEAMTRSAVKR